MDAAESGLADGERIRLDDGDRPGILARGVSGDRLPYLLEVKRVGQGLGDAAAARGAGIEEEAVGSLAVDPHIEGDLPALQHGDLDEGAGHLGAVERAGRRSG